MPELLAASDATGVCGENVSHHHYLRSVFVDIQLLPSEQLAHSTVRIECQLADGTTGTGTGFFYQFAKVGNQHVPAIVTNKHVIAGAVTGKFSLTQSSADGKPLIGQHVTVQLDQFEGRWIPHPDPTVDLCALPIEPLRSEAQARGTPFFSIYLDEQIVPSAADLQDLGTLEDILMIGYPNGLWDSINNMPIFRRGVTATHPNLDYEGKREFLIDAACFPGSSGSPVFLFNTNGWTQRNGGTVVGGTRVKLLGVLYAGPQHTATGEVRIINVPTQQRAVSVSTIPNNLGFVIKASRLTELDKIVRAAAGLGA